MGWGGHTWLRRIPTYKNDTLTTASQEKTVLTGLAIWGKLYTYILYIYNEIDVYPELRSLGIPAEYVNNSKKVFVLVL